MNTDKIQKKTNEDIKYNILFVLYQNKNSHNKTIKMKTKRNIVSDGCDKTEAISVSSCR